MSGVPLNGRVMVVCAHYDGAGQARDGLYCPGSIDNASARLEVAAELSRQGFDKGPPMMFVATDAEEAVMLGSDYLVHHLPLPKKSLDFALVMDCIAVRGAETMLLWGTSKEMDGLRDLARESWSSDGSQVTEFTPAPAGDHQPFNSIGVPALVLMTPLGEFRRVYHRPADTPSEVDPAMLEKLVKLAVRIAMTYEEIGRGRSIHSQ
jgi:Zn-dependent M28 family amino/carboxypeptidase